MRLAVMMMIAASATPAISQTIVPAAPYSSNVDGFIVTEGDISDRPYIEVGTVSAKTTKFSLVSKNSNREMVDIKLREKARQLGANAVVRVRYGSTGISLMNWGGVRVEGVAVRFTQP